MNINWWKLKQDYGYRFYPLVCFKGGSGGGGGGSGAVSHSAYLETIHGDWLDNSGVDTITESITDVMNSALGNSPWTLQNAYDPDADLVTMLAAPDELQSLVTLLSTGTTLDTLISNVLDTARIDDAVDEFAADLDARLISEILPRFNAGMLDINAVMSSAFVIGRANIEENQDRQVAKYAADLHMKAFSDDAIRLIALKLEYQKTASQMIADANRIKIVAKKEESETNFKLDESDALWDLEVFQHGGNLLAAIGGGTATPGATSGPSQMQSAIGGALTGAAAGAMVGGPTGAAIGGVLGAASAFL